MCSFWEITGESHSNIESRLEPVDSKFDLAQDKSTNQIIMTTEATQNDSVGPQTFLFFIVANVIKGNLFKLKPSCGNWGRARY